MRILVILLMVLSSVVALAASETWSAYTYRITYQNEGSQSVYVKMNYSISQCPRDKNGGENIISGSASTGVWIAANTTASVDLTANCSTPYLLEYAASGGSAYQGQFCSVELDQGTQTIKKVSSYNSQYGMKCRQASSTKVILQDVG